VLKVAEGRVAVLTCRVSGAPQPSVRWQKGEELVDVEDLHDPRITFRRVRDHADLKIHVCFTAFFYLSNLADGDKPPLKVAWSESRDPFLDRLF